MNRNRLMVVAGLGGLALAGVVVVLGGLGIFRHREPDPQRLDQSCRMEGVSVSGRTVTTYLSRPTAFNIVGTELHYSGMDHWQTRGNNRGDNQDNDMDQLAEDLMDYFNEADRGRVAVKRISREPFFGTVSSATFVQEPPNLPNLGGSVTEHNQLFNSHRAYAPFLRFVEVASQRYVSENGACRPEPSATQTNLRAQLIAPSIYLALTMEFSEDLRSGDEIQIRLPGWSQPFAYFDFNGNGDKRQVSPGIRIFQFDSSGETYTPFCTLGLNEVEILPWNPVLREVITYTVP